MNEIVDAVRQHVWWLAAGLIGRIMFHSREAQAGRRRFWGRELPFEVLLAVGMGLIGSSLCAWFNLDGTVATGVVSATAYLGPRAIDTLWERIQSAAGKAIEKKD